MNTYGDGNVYRGTVCRDSETPTIIIGINGWITEGEFMQWIDPKNMKPSEGQEVVVRARGGEGQRWAYQIGVWSDGHFKNPTMGCDLCGGSARFLPYSWNPFSRPKLEWAPLGKFIEIRQTLRHTRSALEKMEERALRAEELLYRFFIDRDKKAEDAIITYVQEGLDREGLI